MLSILLVGFLSLAGEKTTIINRVLDQSGEPVSFARVHTKDGYTTTNIDGFFSLETESDSIFIDALSFKGVKVCVTECSRPIVLYPLEPKDVRTLK